MMDRTRRSSRKHPAPIVVSAAALLALMLLRPGVGLAADSAPAANGQAIYDKNCGRCHNSGPGAFFTGAPRIGTDVWKTRLAAAGSADALANSAAKGKGKMPAQGGPSGLSDADLKAAVDYILSKTPQ